MYGLTLLLAIVACIVLTGFRWVRRGGDWDLVLRVAVWGVAFGVVGARAYHDITSWDEVPEPEVEGHLRGLAGRPRRLGRDPARLPRRRHRRAPLRLPRARLHGRRRAGPPARPGHRPLGQLVEPGAVRQADLAAVGPEDRPAAPAAGYAVGTHFHPTFLYEFVYDLIGVAVLLLLDRRFRFKPPALFALYVSIYTAFRTYEETLRIDPSHHLGGQRVNFYVSLVVFVVSTAFFVWWQFLRRSGEEEERPKGPERKRDTGPAMAIPKGRVRPSR